MLSRSEWSLIRSDQIQDRIVAATGKTVHAALDPSGRPCRLPARVREVFA